MAIQICIWLILISVELLVAYIDVNSNLISNYELYYHLFELNSYVTVYLNCCHLSV